MSSSEIIWAQRVQALMPHLTIEQLEVNQDGLVNDVVIVNQDWSFDSLKPRVPPKSWRLRGGFLI